MSASTAGKIFYRTANIAPMGGKNGHQVNTPNTFDFHKVLLKPYKNSRLKQNNHEQILFDLLSKHTSINLLTSL